MHRLLSVLGLLLFVAACGADDVYAPPDRVARSAYVDPTAGAYVTLYTVINNQNGAGAHSGLLISGSQRVLFDPAGSWFSVNAPERHDVHYGITDNVLRFYIDYHARLSYRVVQQTVPVSTATADALIRAAEAYGSVPKGQCARAITAIMEKVPALGANMRGTWFPLNLSKQFGRLPGASQSVIYDDDSDDNAAMLLGDGAAAPVPVAATGDADGQ